MGMACVRVHRTLALTRVLAQLTCMLHMNQAGARDLRRTGPVSSGWPAGS